MPKGVTPVLGHESAHSLCPCAWSACLLPGTWQAMGSWGARPGSLISASLASCRPLLGTLSADFLEFEFVPTTA